MPNMPARRGCHQGATKAQKTGISTEKHGSKRGLKIRYSRSIRRDVWVVSQHVVTWSSNRRAWRIIRKSRSTVMSPIMTKWERQSGDLAEMLVTTIRQKSLGPSRVSTVSQLRRVETEAAWQSRNGALWMTGRKERFLKRRLSEYLRRIFPTCSISSLMAVNFEGVFR